MFALRPRIILYHIALQRLQDRKTPLARRQRKIALQHLPGSPGRGAGIAPLDGLNGANPAAPRKNIFWSILPPYPPPIRLADRWQTINPISGDTP